MKTVLIPVIVPLTGSASGHYVLNCARYLSKLGYKVVIVSASNDLVTINNEIRAKNIRREIYSDILVEDVYYPHGELADFPSFTGHFIQHHHFTFHKMTMKQVNTYISFLSDSIAKAISAHQPDYIMAGHIAPLPGIIAELFSKSSEIKPIPVISIAFGSACSCSLKDKSRFVHSEVYEKLFVEYLKKGQEIVTKVVAVSNFVKKDLKKLGFADGSIVVAADGYDQDVYVKLKQEIDDYQLVLDTQQEMFQEYNSQLLTSCCAEYRKNFCSDYLGRLYSVIHDGNIFVFTDRFTDSQTGKDFSIGVERLIAAVEVLKEKYTDQFCVIVHGNGRHVHKVISEVYARKLDNIFFVGYQSQGKVINRWYNLASASVMTSYSEQQLSNLLESAAAGVATVVSDDRGFSETAAKLGSHIVRNFPDELAEVMHSAVVDKWVDVPVKKSSFLQNKSWSKIIDKIEKECMSNKN